MSLTASEIQNNVDLKVEFTLNSTPDKIKITDQTDWASLGYSSGDGDTLTGVFKITSPAGVVIHETTNHASPDTTYDSDKVLDDVTFPTDSGGDPLEGDYTVRYELKFTDGVSAAVVTQAVTETHTFSNDTPTAEITASYNCYKGTMEVSETTAYTSATTVTRSTLIQAPIDDDGDNVTADVTFTTKSKTISTIYTGTYSFTVDTDIEIDLGGGSYLVDTVTGVKELKVDCDNNLCTIQCCLQALLNKVETNDGVNERLYQTYLKQWRDVIGYVVLREHAIQCGKYTKATNYLTKIYEIADCDSDCDCGTTSPSLVVGSGTSASTSVVTDSSPITVSGSGTAGDPYVVGLEAATVTAINGIVDPNVTLGTQLDKYLDVTESPDGTFDLTWETGEIDRLDYVIKLDYTSPADVTLTKKLQNLVGDFFVFAGTADSDNPTVQGQYSYATTAQFGNNPAVYIVENFLTANSTNYKVDITIQNYRKGTSNNDIIYSGEFPLTVESTNPSSNEWYFRFIDKSTGMVVTHNHLIDNLDIDFIEVLVRFTRKQS